MQMLTTQSSVGLMRPAWRRRRRARLSAAALAWGVAALFLAWLMVSALIGLVSSVPL